MSNTPLTYAINGFDFVREITYRDLIAAATTKVIDFFPTPADGLVREVGWYVTENFDGGATSALVLEVGVTAVDTDGFVVSKSIHADSTPISSGYSDGALFTVGGDAGTKKAYVIDAASGASVSGLFTATGANLSALTQGRLVVFSNIVNFAKVF